MISNELRKAAEEAAKTLDKWLDKNVKLPGEGEDPLASAYGFEDYLYEARRKEAVRVAADRNSVEPSDGDRNLQSHGPLSSS